MDSPTTPPPERGVRRRGSTISSVTHSVASASQTAVSFTEDLVLRHDPPLGFFAATAAAMSKAPTPGDIRRGSFGQDGWQTSGSGSRSRKTTGSSTRRQSAGSRDRSGLERDAHGMLEPFAPLTEEPTRISTDIDRTPPRHPEKLESANPDTTLKITETAESGHSSAELGRAETDTFLRFSKDQRVYSSGYIPPPKLPWATATWIGLKAFWKWFLTPFGFLVTLYGLNVVAWGGMLFLLLCNASETMCWAPIPNASNRKQVPPATALGFHGPYYYNCNDINSPRRIWLEIDSQILNALFCVTGLGLIPWRFRDLYYLLRWRLASEKRSGREAKMYGLRVLAGIHSGWYRLPGHDTLDTQTTREYLEESTSRNSFIDVENAAMESDPRIPLPTSKAPRDPPTSVRAPPTKPWKLDFFIWCQVWNTFFQIGLCGVMWGLNRYNRPSWTTGLLIALACVITGVGGVVSFIEGKNVKKVEGVVPKEENVIGGKSPLEGQGDETELQEVRTGATGHESIHVGEEAEKEGID